MKKIFLDAELETLKKKKKKDCMMSKISTSHSLAWTWVLRLGVSKKDGPVSCRPGSVLGGNEPTVKGEPGLPAQ